MSFCATDQQLPSCFQTGCAAPPSVTQMLRHCPRCSEKEKRKEVCFAVSGKAEVCGHMGLTSMLMISSPTSPGTCH